MRRLRVLLLTLLTLLCVGGVAASESPAYLHVQNTSNECFQRLQADANAAGTPIQTSGVANGAYDSYRWSDGDVSVRILFVSPNNYWQRFYDCRVVGSDYSWRASVSSWIGYPPWGTLPSPQPTCRWTFASDGC